MRWYDLSDGELALDRIVEALAGAATVGDRPAADLRHRLGSLRAGAAQMLRAGLVGEPLAACFAAATDAGAGLQQWRRVTATITALAPSTAAARAILAAGLRLALVEQSRVITVLAFGSRDEAQLLAAEISAAFDSAISTAADLGEMEVLRAMTVLHGAVIRDLTERGRPLARVVRYTSAEPEPSLVLAHRLYADADRADELVAFNQAVHPAFMPNGGQALSE